MDFFKDIKPLTKYSSKYDDTFPYVKNSQRHTQDVTVTTDTTKENSSLFHHSYSNFSNTRDTSQTQFKHKNNHSSGARGLWVFVFMGLIALGGVISYKYASATIVYTPKVIEIPLDSMITLSSKDSRLPFETTSVDSSIKEQVALSESVNKQEKASGKIVLYNTYSTTNQPLVTGTRFTTKEGLIYKLQNSVAVPGYTNINGKKVPGTVEATIVAADYGEKYNTESAVLSIIAFSGTQKYDLIYAKTSGPISGGLNGVYYTYTSKDEESTTQEKTIVLTNRLKELIRKQVPSDYVYIEGLYVLSIDEHKVFYSKTPEASVGIDGNLTQVVFPYESFQKYIYAKYPELNSSVELDLSGITGKILSVQEDDENPTFTISLDGQIRQSKVINVEQTKETFAGQKKSLFPEKINEFSDSISSAELHIKPFWVHRIPKAINRITIVNSNDRK
jgi:hypothetical protein